MLAPPSLSVVTGTEQKQKEEEEQKLNRKLDVPVAQQIHFSLSVKQNFCKIMGTVTMFLYVKQERVTVVH